VELLLQHPQCNPELMDKDGNTALHHARTPSVKWRIHNHTFRSRSMENVLGRNRSNICHVSPDVPASESLESSPGTPESPGVSNYRHHSLEEFHSIQYSPSRVVLQSEEQSESSSSSTRLSSTSSGHEEEEPVWEDNQLLRRPLLTTSRNGSPQLRARITSSPAEITLSSAAKN